MGLANIPLPKGFVSLDSVGFPKFAVNEKAVVAIREFHGWRRYKYRLQRAGTNKGRLRIFNDKVVRYFYPHELVRFAFRSQNSNKEKQKWPTKK